MASSNQVNIVISAVINDFQRRMEQVQQTLNNTAAHMRQVGDQMQAVGSSMTQYISAPLAALGTAAVVSAAAFDESQGRIQARLGATAEEAANLNKVAQNVWKQGFGENVSEAADAVTTLKASLGDISDTELEAATESAFMLQKAFDVDVTEAAQTASSMVKNFGINSTQAFDIMAATMQATGDVSQDALATLWEYAPAFAEAGLSAKDMANMVVNGMSEGAISSDKLGDSINEFMTLMTDESERSREAITALGFDAKTVEQSLSGGGEGAKGTMMALTAALANVKDQQKQNMLGTALYGSMWEDTGKKAILAMTSGEDALGDINGTALEAGKAIQDNIGTRMVKAWRGIQVALIPVGEVIISVLEKILPYIEKAAAKFQEWFNGLDGGEKKMYVMGAAIAAAIGPALVVLGFVVNMVAGAIGALAKLAGFFKTAFGVAGKVIQGIVTVFSKLFNVVKIVWGWLSKLKTLFNIVRVAILAISGPVWAVIAAVAALIAIGVAVYKNWEQVSAFLAAAWQWIKDAATTVFFTIGAVIFGALSAVWNFISQIFMDIVTTIATQAAAAYNAVVSWFTMIGSAIGSAISAAWNFVKSGFAFIVSTIANAVTTAYNLAKNGFLIMWNAISGAVTNIKDAIVKGFNFMKNFILQAVQTYFRNVKNNFELIKNTISTATAAAKQAAIDAFNKLRDGIGKAISTAFKTVTGFAGDIISTFTDIDLLEIGQNIIEGLANGISGAWGIVKKAAKGVADKLLGGFQDWLGVQSPSVIADREIGQMWGAGLARGLDKSIRPVTAAAKRLSESAILKPGALNLTPAIAADGIYSEIGTRLSGSTPGARRTSGEGENGRVYHLDVPLTVDGREIARATARFTDQELQRMETNRQRAAGVIVR